jgi:UPF0755 protein
MKPLLRILLIILVPALAALATYQVVSSALNKPVDPNDSNLELVEVEADSSFRSICKKIESAGLINNWWVLEALARLKKIDKNVSAGEYQLSRNMPPAEILRKLTSGEIFKRRVTIREGLSVWEIGKLVEEAGVMPKVDFDKAVADAKLLSVAGLNATSFEGYLFPDTYFFSRPTTPKSVVFSMLEQGEKNWPPEYTERADELNFTRHEILTIASIIEKESGNVDEQPLISSVFHNRLNQGMKLQADPTVIYGIPNFNGNLTKQDLQTPSPYNTYTNFGLPPGPIANPGATAIKAALYPKETSFLFFVADGKGNHVFSTTLQEHNEAVRRYQLNGK